MLNFHSSPEDVHQTRQTDWRNRSHRLNPGKLPVCRCHIWSVQSVETLQFRRTIREINVPIGLDATERIGLSVSEKTEKERTRFKFKATFWNKLLARAWFFINFRIVWLIVNLLKTNLFIFYFSFLLFSSIPYFTNDSLFFLYCFGSLNFISLECIFSSFSSY